MAPHTLCLAILLLLAAPADGAACASGTDDTGKTCPPDDSNGACPAGCELSTTTTTSTQALLCSDTDGCMLRITDVVGTDVAETLTQPTEVTATSIALSVEACTVSIANFASFTSRCYCYQGSCTVPGPTLVTTPGASLTVSLTNGLSANPAGQATTMNTMHSPNTVNLHTHGLHIDPAIDTVFVHIEPGETHTYSYQIPPDHAPGFHWCAASLRHR